MRTFGKFVGKTILLVFVLMVVGLAYLQVEGFPGFLTRFATDQLAKAGVVARFDAVRVDLFRGLVAENATLADTKNPDRPWAQISEVELRLDLARLLRRQNAIAGLHIANATVSVPTPADEFGSEEFHARDAYATFRFEEDGAIHIDRLTGVYLGVGLHVTGKIRPSAAPPPEPSVRPAAPAPAPAEDPSRRFLFVTKVVRELARLRVNTPPQLDLNFDVDLADPLRSQVKLRLRGAGMEYRDLAVDTLAVQLAMQDGAVLINQLRAELYGGAIEIHGRYDIAHGEFDLRLASTTDPTGLMAVLPEQTGAVLRPLRVHKNPDIKLRYRLSAETGTLPQLDGQVAAGPLEYRQVRFETVNFNFVHRGLETKFFDGLVRMAEGQLTGHGQYHWESSDFEYALESTLDPTKLLPLMTPALKRLIEPSEFRQPPHIVATVSGDFVDPDALAYDARVTARHCSYRGVAFRRGSATLRLRNSVLEVSKLHLGREDGELSGSLTVEFNRHRTSFELASTANPLPLAPVIGPAAVTMMEPYRFGSKTRANARGVIDFEQPDRTTWEAQVDGERFSAWQFSAERGTADLSYTDQTLVAHVSAAGAAWWQLKADKAVGALEVNSQRINANVFTEGLGWWKLKADQARANIAYADQTLTIDSFNADLHQGVLAGNARVGFNHPEVNYQLRLRASNCDVHKLIKDMGGQNREVSGTLDGAIELRGIGSDLKSLEGQGNLKITDAVLAEVPLFGVFSVILNGITPGLGTVRVTQAKASFKLADNTVKTDDIQMSAGAFTLNSHGELTLEGRLDFYVQAHLLRSVPGINILTWMLGKMFEYKVGGTLTDPNYRPVRLPKEIMPHGS